jgi:YGGT family
VQLPGEERDKNDYENKEKYSMNNQPYSPDPRMQDEQQASRVGAAYYQRRQESYVGSAGNQVETSTVDVEDTNLTRATLRRWIATVSYFVLSVLEVILLLRFFFRLLGANQGSDFVRFLYSLSHVFVAPFNGIFNDQTLGSRSVLEVSTLIAMMVLALIVWGIVSLSRVILAPSLKNEQRVTTIRRRSP